MSGSRKASDDDLADVFKRASALASTVPESMQAAAFDKAVELLSEGQSGSAKATAKKGGGSSKGKANNASKSAEPDRSEALIKDINRTDYPQVAGSARVVERALWILRIAHDDHGVDGLTAPEVAKILSTKFRLSATPQGVRKALDGAGAWVDRDSSKQVTEYRIMGPGEKHLDDDE